MTSALSPAIVPGQSSGIGQYMHPVTGQVSDAQTRGGHKDSGFELPTSLAPGQSEEDNGGSDFEDPEGEDNPGAKAAEITKQKETENIRDQVVHELQKQNIMARKYFWPACHNMAPYQRRRHGGLLPVTKLVANRVIVLPTGQQTGARDIKSVCRIITQCLPARK